MSSQQKKLIERASDQELRDFAELNLMLTIPVEWLRSQIIGAISPAWPAPHIFVDVAELAEADDVQSAEVRAAAQQQLVTGDSKDDPKWLIRIAATELPGGKDPVPVGVNGRVVVIQRGMEAEVPHRYVEALRNAVRVSITQNPRTQEMTYSKFTNYPFEVLERPSRDEIEQFHERTKDLALA